MRGAPPKKPLSPLAQLFGVRKTKGSLAVPWHLKGASRYSETLRCTQHGKQPGMQHGNRAMETDRT